MPANLDQCVKALIEDGYDEKNAWAICTAQMNESFEDETYNGEQVTLNKPFPSDEAGKSFGVYVKNKQGRVVLIRFGKPEYLTDDGEAKKEFYAQYKCDQRTDKTTPAYWTCKLFVGS
jgi:hypothetical protein